MTAQEDQQETPLTAVGTAGLETSIGAMAASALTTLLGTAQGPTVASSSAAVSEDPAAALDEPIDKSALASKEPIDESAPVSFFDKVCLSCPTSSRFPVSVRVLTFVLVRPLISPSYYLLTLHQSIRPPMKQRGERPSRSYCLTSSNISRICSPRRSMPWYGIPVK